MTDICFLFHCIMSLSRKISFFKIIAALEGISFLVLLGIAMPMKYMWGEPWMVQKVGMAHGLLFVLYVLAVFQLKSDFGWNTKQLGIALLGSVLPFGTFYVTGKMLPEIKGGSR